MLGLGAAHAQSSTSYVYDANGRVVAVTANTGTSVQYSYNTLGHTSQISTPLSPGQLAIFAFMPTHGEAGTQVTIQGQGFDSNAANDTVSFNGAVATVFSASSTQLVTTVPSGATTGPISVTVGSQTATSATPFVIDDTGVPPTIMQVSPLVTSVGSTITVTGTHLDPVAGYTTLQMGGHDIPALSAVSDTQLQYVVPGNGATGYVTVETPYGLSTSATPVIVLPNGVSTSSVVSNSNATVSGGGVNLNIGASGQLGAVTFTAPQSGWVSLQASGITTSASSISYTVYAPGNRVVQQGSISSASPSIHLPHLLGGATYLVLVQPNGGGAQMTLGVEANALLATNTVANVVTTVPGQSKRVLFYASTGQNLAFQINSTNTNPSGNTVTYAVYTPSGTSYTSATTTNTGVINLGNLSVPGTYQVVIAPGSGITVNTQVEVTPGVTGTLNATPHTYATNASGQNVYLSFTATQGENLELTLNNASMAGATYNQFVVNVYNSAGAQIAYFWCYPSNPGASCSTHLWYLPADQYSVVVTPYYGGTLSFNALLQDDLIGPTISTNGTASVTLAAGQVERFTFNANAGDTLALNVGGITTTPGGQPVAFLVYRPDAGAITVNTPAYTSFSPTSAQTVNLPNLPVSGTYTVIVAPNGGLPTNAQLSVIGGETGTVPATGESQSYATNVAGENIYLSFTATQGQDLELTLNNLSITGGYGEALVNVYNVSGGQVASFWCYPSSPNGSCTQHLWYLPAGTYSVVATPYGGGSMSFNALIQPDIVGPAITDNNPVNISLGTSQVERYTFNANAGDTIALNVSGVTTTPAGQGVAFLVYRPDAGAITVNTPAYTSFGPTSAQTVNLPNLPISGTYTVIVAPNYGLAANAQLDVVSGVTGSVSAGGVAQSYATNVTSQNVYLSFTATQGQDLELTLNNLSVTGGYGEAFVNVYNASGGQVASFWCYPSSPSGSCTQHLWYLPAGNYSVVATPYGGGSMSFNALIQSDIVGPAITDNNPVNISLGTSQVERYTFNANAGDTIALNVSGVTTTPAGQGVAFLVYRPDAGAITVNTPAYTSFGPTSAQTVNLPSLPVSGTYTVIVAPNYGLATNAQLDVVSGVAGSVSTGGVAQSYATNVAGENIYLSFTATQGQDLELTLNNLSITGGNGEALVNVYNASDGQVASFWCYPSSPGGSCTQHLWYLPAGTYSVVATPYGGGSMSFNALIQPDIVGPTIATGGTANISLGAGQIERYTFNANAGDTVALNVSGITTTPSGQSVAFLVYRPDAGAITVNTPVYTSFGPTGAQTVNLSNLPVSGTYTVIVAPNVGLPATAALSVSSDTSGPGPSYGTPTLPTTGATQGESASGAGQNVTMTFNANQGDNLELTLSNINVPGASNNGFYVNIYDPSGANIAGYYCYASNPGASCWHALWNLAAGTYSVVVNPTWGGTLNFNAQIEPDVTGPALVAGTSTTVNLGAGQAQRLTFNANVGDTVALNLSGVSTTSPTGQYVYVNIYRPDTGAITPTNYYTYFIATGSATLNLQNLPASGTYTAVVYTVYGTPATAQLTLYPGTTGNVVSNGAAQSFAASTSSENVYFTFNANLGDNQELTLNNINVPGSYNSGGVEVYINDPNGTNIASYVCYNINPGSSCRQALWNLIAGTYSVVVVPVWGGTPSFSAQLSQDVVGPSLAMSTPMTVNLGAGQAQRLTFNANIGDTVALNLSGVSTTSPTGQYVYVNIYRPDTGAITPTNYYTYFIATGSATLNLQNLPASGTYTAVVYTVYGTPATAQLTLYPGTTGNVVSNGVAQSFAASTAGENVYFTFNANLGDNQELTLSNINVPGSYNGGGVEVSIYDPNSTNIANYYCYNTSPGSSCRQALWNLIAGTYSVVVTPVWGGTPSFSAQLSQDVVGPSLAMSTPTTINLGAGQAQRLTFNANIGDTVALNLSGVSTTSPTGQYVYVNIYRPDTGAITPTNYYTYFIATGSATLNLQNLPASGTYTAVVYTVYGTPATAQLTLYPGTTGNVVSNGVAQSFAASTASENVYFTFNANLGDNQELTLSNINVPDSSNIGGFEVSIYDPNSTNIANYYCYNSNPGSSCRQALWNLAAGTYSVVVTPVWGGTPSFTAQLSQDVIGQLAGNNLATITLGSGQVERLAFNANLGQQVVLTLSGVSTTAPTGQTVYVTVYRPDTGAITTANYYSYLSASSSSAITLSNLPATGIYTAVAYTTYGTPATAQLSVATQ